MNVELRCENLHIAKTRKLINVTSYNGIWIASDLNCTSYIKGLK